MGVCVCVSVCLCKSGMCEKGLSGYIFIYMYIYVKKDMWLVVRWTLVVRTFPVAVGSPWSI